MKKQISSKMTFFNKFILPLFGIFLFLIINDEYKIKFFRMPIWLCLFCCIFFIAIQMYNLWQAFVLKVVYLNNDELIVSDYFRKDIIPLANVIDINAREFPNYPVEIRLSKPSIFGNVIYFCPHLFCMQYLANRSFFDQYKGYYNHPIVLELSKLIKR